MRGDVRLILLFMLLWWPRSTCADAPPSRTELIQAGLAAIHADERGEALAVARALRERDPDDPVGPFIAATAHQASMTDYRLRGFEADFEVEIAEAIRKSRARVESHPMAEDYFLLVAAQASRAYYLFRRGRWWTALGAARTGMRSLGEARRLEPAFVDPVLGLALYQYGKSKVRFLGIALSRARLGDTIAELEQVRDGGRYVSVSALYSLQLVLYEARDFEGALAANERLYTRYPRHPVCLYNRALILEGLGRGHDAAPVWDSLTEVLRSRETPSHGFLAECYLHRARLWREAGRADAADAELARAVDEVNLYSEERELSGPYRAMSDIRADILRTSREWGAR